MQRDRTLVPSRESELCPPAPATPRTGSRAGTAVLLFGMTSCSNTGGKVTAARPPGFASRCAISRNAERGRPAASPFASYSHRLAVNNVATSRILLPEEDKFSLSPVFGRYDYRGLLADCNSGISLFTRTAPVRADRATP